MVKPKKIRICSIILVIAYVFSLGLFPSIHAKAAGTSNDQPQLKLGVLSDLHYYPLEYSGDLGEAYQKFISGDTLLHGESAPALDSAIEMILDDAPDALIITGNITDNGEQLGAEEVAVKLRTLEYYGIKVYVINGTADINNSGAVSFGTGSATPANNVTPSEFRSIFSEFGYNGDDHAVYYQPVGTSDSGAAQGGLSYVVSPMDGFKLMMIDTEVYTGGYAGSSRALISEDLLTWITEQIEIANENDETMIVGMHHSLLPHYSGDTAAALCETIDNSALVASQLANAGVKYVFSGHFNATDIARYTTTKGNQLLDMATGSLAAYGAPVRMATISNDNISVESKSVQTITWQGKRINYQTYIKEKIYSGEYLTETAGEYVLDSFLDDFQQAGIKETIESLAGFNIDQYIAGSIREALADGPFEEEIDAGGVLGDVTVIATYYNGSDPYIQLKTDGSWVVEESLPKNNVSVKNNIIKAVNEMFNEFDAVMLKGELDGTSKLEKYIMEMLSETSDTVVYTAAGGSKKTVNDFLCEMMKANQTGGETPPAWAQQVMEDLKIGLTRSLIKEIFIPYLKTMLNESTDDVHLNINTLIPSEAAWRSVIAYALTGDTDNRTPTLGELMVELDMDMNAEIDKFAAEYIDNDSNIGMVGQPLSLFCGGIWNDTDGADDKVDGAAVSYQIADAVDNDADVSFSDISLGTGSSQSELHVTWYSTSTEPGTVRIAEKTNKPVNEDFPSDDAAYAEFAAINAVTNVTGFYSNKAVITGLKENTQYIYRVGNEEQWSKVYSYTAGDFDGDFSFLAAGDPQIGSSGNAGNDISDWDNTLNLAFGRFSNTSFLLSLGDQVDVSDSETQYAGFLEHDVLKELKISTVVGNHDDGSEAYSQHFNNPNVENDSGTSGTGEEAGDYWYVYNNTLFMIINANNTNSAEHRAFMEKAISMQAAGITWKIAAFHQSIYSAASHSDSASILQLRDNLAPIMSDLDVDLVLMGHDHAYARTYMMNATTPQDTAEGVTGSVTDPEDGDVLYITLNSASSKHYTLKNTNFTYTAVKNQESLDNITNVEVTDTSLTITTYRTESADHVPVAVSGMTVVDQFTIFKTGEDEDKTAPVITTPGDAAVGLGTVFNPLEGVTAMDETDGDLTGQIIVEGTVDADTAGEYRLVYTVSDTAGNEVSVIRIITVTGEDVSGVTLEDIPTGITVIGRLPEQCVLDAYRLTGGTVYEEALRELEKIAGTEAEHNAVFDLDVMKNGVSVAAVGGWELSAPVPEGFGISRILVYQYSESDNHLERLQAVIENGAVNFGSESLGVFVIAETGYIVAYEDGVDEEAVQVPEDGTNQEAGSACMISDDIPERAGYVFEGWMTDDDMTYQPGDSFVMPACDVTLTALWTESQNEAFSVTFNDGVPDEIVSVPDQDTVVSGSTYTVPETAPIRIGYAFMGWKLNNGTVCQSGAALKMPAEDMTLTALWAEDTNGNGKDDGAEAKYKVAYKDGIEGEIVIVPVADKNLLSGLLYTVSAGIPDRTDNAFVGWQLSGDTTYQPGDAFMMPGCDIVLTALWSADLNNNEMADNQEDKYTVTYKDGAEGEVIQVPNMETDLTSGISHTLSGTVPDRMGYVFKGWSLEGTVYQTGATFIMPENNLVLNALWEAEDGVGSATVTGGEIEGDKWQINSGGTITAPVYRYNRTWGTPVLSLTAASDKSILTQDESANLKLAADWTADQTLTVAGDAFTVAFSARTRSAYYHDVTIYSVTYTFTNTATSAQVSQTVNYNVEMDKFAGNTKTLSHTFSITGLGLTSGSYRVSLSVDAEKHDLSSGSFGTIVVPAYAISEMNKPGFASYDFSVNPVTGYAVSAPVVSSDITESAAEITRTDNADGSGGFTAMVSGINSTDGKTYTGSTGFTLYGARRNLYTFTADPAKISTVIPETVASQTVLTGGAVTIPAIIAADGWKFTGWEPVIDTETMTADGYDHAFTAQFEEIPAETYSVTISPLTGGSVTADAASAAEGTTINLTVTPDEGMQLVAGSLKYLDGTNEYAVTGTSFVMPAANVTVTAQFEEIPAETKNVLEIENAAGNQGSDITVKVTAKNTEDLAGIKTVITYDADKLELKGIEVSSALGASAVNDETAGRIVISAVNSSGITVPELEIAELTFTSKAGYAGTTEVSFESVEACNSSTGSLDFAKTNGSITVSGVSGSTSHSISIGALAGGSITADKAEAEAGETVTLTITPDEGMRLVVGSLKYTDGTTEYAITGTSFEMPDAAVTITAEFEEIPEATYSISLGTLTGGVITADKAEAEAGETVTLTITPNEGMRLKAGTLKYSDGTTEYAIAGTSFTMPAADVTVTAEFELIPEEPGTLPVATDVTFTGETVVGETLEAQYTYHDESETPESGTAFRWLAAAHGTGNYIAIEGASGRTFTVTAEYAGMDIRVEVAPVNENGAGMAVTGDNGNNQVVLLGDRNNDGKVNFVDAMLLMQTVTGDGGVAALDSKTRAIVDVNNDGDVNILDVIKILRADVGLDGLN